MKRLRAALNWLYQEEVVAAPPDSGCAAWSVVLGAGIISALASGSQFVFGIIYVALLEEFGQPPAITSGVVSFEFFSMLGCGVFAGRLVQRLGAQRVATIGGALVGIGFISSSFSATLYPLFVSIGLVIGCGCSLALNSAASHPPKFFVKWRSTAAGIAVASSGIGTMALAPLVRTLISEYGWRTALRVLGVICSVGIILAAQLFRPLRVDPFLTDPLHDLHPQTFNAGASRGAVLRGVRGEAGVDAGSTVLELQELGDATIDEAAHVTTVPANTVHNPTGIHATASRYVAAFAAASGLELVVDPLIGDRLFQTWMLLNCLYAGCFFTVIAHFAQWARETGTGEWSAALVAAQGMGNMVGRVLMGLISDRPNMKRGRLIALGLIPLGVVVSLVNLMAGNAAAQITFMSFSGLGGGALVSSAPFVLEFVGMRRLPRERVSCAVPCPTIRPLFVSPFSLQKLRWAGRRQLRRRRC